MGDLWTYFIYVCTVTNIFYLSELGQKGASGTWLWNNKKNWKVDLKWIYSRLAKGKNW